MLRKAQVSVLDATVLIDICHGGILSETLTMLVVCHSPDLVCAEVNETSIPELESMGLVAHELSGAEILKLQMATASYPGLTHKDVAALRLAVEKQAILLTGDRRLAHYAQQEKVEAHGVLWILDHLVEGRLISPERATEALEAIQKHGSWLPEDECKKRIERWRAQIARTQTDEGIGRGTG